MDSHVPLAELSPYAIPLAALIVSAAALVYGAIGGRRTTMTGIEASLNNRLTDLVRQVDELKEELHECTRQRASLERENIALMRQVMNLRDGEDP
jgi:cell division protein FtsB